jgi:ketosteroid isomerase-like protein
MAFLGPLADRLELRELLDSYGDAVLRQDAADWGALWAREAVWSLAGTQVRGRDAIVAAWRAAMADFAITAFVQAPGSLAVDGERAHGDCQTVERLITQDGVIRDIRGAYRDRFVREDGGWRFAERIYRIVHELPA